MLSPLLFSPLNTTVTYVPRKTPTTYVQSYQLSVQRQLASNLFFDIAYVGNTGTHELILADYNQATPNASTATCNATVTTGCLTLQARRPIANFAGIGDSFNEGHSNYNSLQTKIEKRFSKGFFFINSFTYSRGFDLAAGHLEASNNDSEYVNIRNINSSYGPSNYDQPFNETFSTVYDLPYGRGRRFGSHINPALDEALGGWQVTAITQYTSGLPTNLSYAENTASADVSDLVTYRPNLVAGQAVLAAASALVKTAGALNGYPNPAAVTIPDPSQPFGNAGRNDVRGPNYTDLDLGLHKRFALYREGQALEFRAEALTSSIMSTTRPRTASSLTQPTEPSPAPIPRVNCRSHSNCSSRAPGGTLNFIKLFCATVTLFSLPVFADAQAGIFAQTGDQLKFVVILSRHGVRSPTKPNDQLDPYAAQRWPAWEVKPGELTPRGAELLHLFGTYDQAWLRQAKLLPASGCPPATAAYFWADTDHRTLESASALAESILPGCAVKVHSLAVDAQDPLFHPLAAGIAPPSAEAAIAALASRLHGDPGQSVAANRPALDLLAHVLAPDPDRPPRISLHAVPASIAASKADHPVSLLGPLATASTLSEKPAARVRRQQAAQRGRLGADRRGVAANPAISTQCLLRPAAPHSPACAGRSVEPA